MSDVFTVRVVAGAQAMALNIPQSKQTTCTDRTSAGSSVGSSARMMRPDEAVASEASRVQHTQRATAAVPLSPRGW